MKMKANIILKDKIESFSSKINNKRRMCTLSPFVFNTVLKVLTSTIGEEKEIKGILSGKKANTISVHR